MWRRRWCRRPARIGARIDLDKGCVLLGLRRSLSPQILNRIPAPLGLQAGIGQGEPRDGNGQHEMGPDRQVAGQYGPVVYGNQARWNIRPNNTLPQPHPPPKICSGSGALIAPCKTAAPRVYLQWIKRFRAYCARHELDERAELTLSGARRFIARYAQLRRLDPRRLGGARTALYALSRVYHVMGLDPPAWQPPKPTSLPATALLREYADHLARHRGNPETTVHKKLAHIGKLSEHLAASDKAVGHDGADGYRCFPDRMRGAVCAFDRGRHRRKRPLFCPVPACHGAHLNRTGRVRGLARAAQVRASPPRVAVEGRAAPAARGGHYPRPEACATMRSC